MPRYEFRHPLRTFGFEAKHDEEAQEIWKVGFALQREAALKTRLIRLSDEADITPSSDKAT